MSEDLLHNVRSQPAATGTKLPLSDRLAMILGAARAIFDRCEHWTKFHAQVLGVRGIVRQYLTEPAELEAFEQSAVHAEIQDMVVQLRIAERSQEPTRVITVRLPKSLSDALTEEAKSRNTSVNKLCICKLTQHLDDEAFTSWQEDQPNPKSRVTLQHLRYPR
jgi:predicted HicB family RNase H-like nuclease